MSVTAANVNDLESLIAVSRQLWVEEGTPPPSTVIAMGRFLRTLKKSDDADGVTINGTLKGDGFVLIPLQLGDGANPSSQFSKGATSHVELDYKQFKAPVVQLWQHIYETWLAQEMGKGGGRKDVSPEQQMDSTVRAFYRGLSWMIHENGSGAIAKLDGSAQVGGAILTLKNRDLIHRFRRGDKLSFAAGPRVPGTLLTRRDDGGGLGAYVTVTKVNKTLGKLELDGVVTAAIPTATDNDYLVLDSAYKDTSLSDPGKSKQITGLDGWNPITNTDALLTLHEIDRSIDPTALAGMRVPIDGTGFHSAISELAGHLSYLPDVLGGGGEEVIDGTLLFPAKKNKNLMQAFAAEHIHVSKVSDGGRTPTNVRALQFGMDVAVAHFPTGHRLALMSDTMMADMEVTAANDWTLRVCLTGNGQLLTGSSGLTWQLRDGRSPMQPVDGTSDVLGAPFGGAMQFVPGNTAAHIVCSTRAED